MALGLKQILNVRTLSVAVSKSSNSFRPYRSNLSVLIAVRKLGAQGECDIRSIQ